MAYLTLTDLVQRCLRRLRQVPGVTTQAYSEDHIADLLEEVYEEVRALRWWDHLTSYQTRTLDGTTGRVTVPFVGARDRYRDVQGVYYDRSPTPLPITSFHRNPTSYTGTRPRLVEPLDLVADATGMYLFRVWPLASQGTVHVRLRADPYTNLFDDAANRTIPFDATCLINGACMKYAIMDGTNPGAVGEFDRAYNERVLKLQQQHDSTPLHLDDRFYQHINEWTEMHP